MASSSSATTRVVVFLVLVVVGTTAARDSEGSLAALHRLAGLNNDASTGVADVLNGSLLAKLEGLAVDPPAPSSSVSALWLQATGSRSVNFMRRLSLKACLRAAAAWVASVPLMPGSTGTSWAMGWAAELTGAVAISVGSSKAFSVEAPLRLAAVEIAAA
jgi:hypothetical protein